MKKIFTFIFTILLWIVCFPQTKVQPKKSVMNFITTVENYTKDYNRINEKELFKSKNYTKGEALSLAKQYPKVEAEDPVGFDSYEKEKRKEFEEKFKKNGHWVRTNELMFADKVGIIYKIISSYYGRAFTEIISVPWYLKFRVLDIKYGKFKSSTGNLPVEILVAKVEDVIKGKNFFKQGDTVEINLRPWWLDTYRRFEKNKSYFESLWTWNCYSGNCYKIALYMFSDKNNGIYPIENGNVVAPDNYFGIKNNLKWPEFKNKFEKKYILFEE